MKSTVPEHDSRNGSRATPTGSVCDDGLMTVGGWLRGIDASAAVESAVIDELRAELEAAAGSAAEWVRAGEGRSSSLPIRLSKSRLADLESCERRALANALPRASPEPSAAMLAGIALDQFVAHRLFAGRVLDPPGALAEMLAASGDLVSLEALERLDRSSASELLAPMAAAAEAWADVDNGWLPRLQSRAVAVFARGDLICSGVMDVELGGEGTGRPGVVVEVKSGTVGPSHVQEVYLYALLVALRDGRAPDVVARWYPDRSPAAVSVTEGVLRAAAARLGDAMLRWSELLSGSIPVERPGPSCSWCPDLAICPGGNGAMAEGSGVLRS